MNPKNLCPLTGAPGHALQCIEGRELLMEYGRLYSVLPPEEFRAEFFSQPVTEYQSEESGLRWYSPRRLADGRFYSWLTMTFPWYSRALSWDKRRALDWLQAQNIVSFLELGCGDGSFLQLAWDRSISGVGTDFSEEMIAKARAKGLRVYHASEPLPNDFDQVEVLCMFQILEHLDDPLQELRNLLDRHKPRHLLVSVPSWDSILGEVMEPLSWPPHHATAWSGKALQTLGDRIGASHAEIWAEPLDFSNFCAYFYSQKKDRLSGSGLRFHGDLQRLRLRWAWLKWQLGRARRCRWALRGHSVMAVYTFA